MPIIILFVIFFVWIIHTLSNSVSYSDTTILRISNSLQNIFPLPSDFPTDAVVNKNQFNENWKYITDKIFYFDRLRDVTLVNIWSYYAVKYYSQYVLKYGSSSQKRILKNFIRLLEINHLT